MATMIRYEPWALHRGLVNEVNRYFVRSSGQGASGGNTAAAPASEWTPLVDIEEYADKFVIFADVPGVDPASIEVTLEKGVLSLAGKREAAVEKEGVNARRRERASGRFVRRFNLPDTVDGDSVVASGHNGAIEITIPKRASVQPRRIAVNADVTH